MLGNKAAVTYDVSRMCNEIQIIAESLWRHVLLCHSLRNSKRSWRRVL